jgi:hypothetical protein
MKLVKVIKSPKPGKKWRAIFKNEDGKEKHTDFGASGMDDFTLTGDKEQRERYRARHKKDLETGDPTKAGHLSWFLLWGNSQSLESNIASYKRRFNL